MWRHRPSQAGALLWLTCYHVAVVPSHGSVCSLSGFPELKSLVRTMRSMAYNEPVNNDPVQGLHLALAGRDRLRATWMNPASGDPQSFSPMCSYWSGDTTHTRSQTDSTASKGQASNVAPKQQTSTTKILQEKTTTTSTIQPDSLTLDQRTFYTRNHQDDTTTTLTPQSTSWTPDQRTPTGSIHKENTSTNTTTSTRQPSTVASEERLSSAENYQRKRTTVRPAADVDQNSVRRTTDDSSIRSNHALKHGTRLSPTHIPSNKRHGTECEFSEALRGSIHRGLKISNMTKQNGGPDRRHSSDLSHRYDKHASSAKRRIKRQLSGDDGHIRRTGQDTKQNTVKRRSDAVGHSHGRQHIHNQDFVTGRHIRYPESVISNRNLVQPHHGEVKGHLDSSSDEHHTQYSGGDRVWTNSYPSMSSGGVSGSTHLRRRREYELIYTPRHAARPEHTSSHTLASQDKKRSSSIEPAGKSHRLVGIGALNLNHGNRGYTQTRISHTGTSQQQSDGRLHSGKHGDDNHFSGMHGTDMAFRNGHHTRGNTIEESQHTIEHITNRGQEGRAVDRRLRKAQRTKANTYRTQNKKMNRSPSSGSDGGQDHHNSSAEKDRTSRSPHHVAGRPYSYREGGLTGTLNTAVLDLTVIPCSSSTGPCVKAFTYTCGDEGWGFSQPRYVTVHDSSAPPDPKSQIAVVGDLGLPQGQPTIDSITARLRPSSHLRSASVDLVLHNGDISYADFRNKTGPNSQFMVDYMNKMQAVAARVPYMTSPGNHEKQHCFAAYRNWFPMPHEASRSSSPFWFSFDYLGVHVLSFSTEHTFRHQSPQRAWMEADLKRANANRANVPWVVVMAHRPLYCTTEMCHKRCSRQAPKIRRHVENLLHEQKVDVVLTSHNHQYERTFPVFRNKLLQRNYTRAAGPVYVVNGAAGNPEVLDPTFLPGVSWRAAKVASLNTGYLLMTPSASRLAFDYVMSKSGQVLDSFTIVKT